MSHHTHEWTFNFQSVIYTLYEEVFSAEWSIPKRYVYIWSPSEYFDLILCILEFRFCIFDGQPFLNKTPAEAFTPPANEKKMGTIWIFVHYAVYGSGRGRCNLVPRLLSALPVPSRCERTLVLSGHVIRARLPYEVRVGRLITFVSNSPNVLKSLLYCFIKSGLLRFVVLRKHIFWDRTRVLKSVIHKLVYLASFSHGNIILNTSCATRLFIT